MEEIGRTATGRVPPPFLRLIEITLAFLGGFNCVAVPLFFAAQELSFTPPRSGFWPAPGLYFLEILFIGLATTYFVLTNQTPQPNRWSSLPWISAGILLTFVIMGIFSIGLFLIPAMLFFLAAAILGDRRQGGNWPNHVVYFFFAAMVQAAAVYLVSILSLR